MSHERDPEAVERPAPWREGQVDQSETHIKIRYGGILDEDPPGVDIALVGPDADGSLIVEFLSMSELDTDKAQELRERAAWKTDMVTEGWSPRWRKLLREPGTTSNAYGPLRYLTMAGTSPLRYIASPRCLDPGSVAKQPLRVEGVGPTGQFAIYNKGEYVGVHLLREGKTIKAWLASTKKDAVAAVVTQPVPAGCVLRRIFEPSETGSLVDDDGVLTERGREVVIELVNQMHCAAVALEEYVDEIRIALSDVRRQFYDRPSRMPPEKEEWLGDVSRKMRNAVPEIDRAIFKSVVGKWIERGMYGLRDPIMGDWRR